MRLVWEHLRVREVGWVLVDQLLRDVGLILVLVCVSLCKDDSLGAYEHVFVWFRYLFDDIAVVKFVNGSVKPHTRWAHLLLTLLKWRLLGVTQISEISCLIVQWRILLMLIGRSFGWSFNFLVIVQIVDNDLLLLLVLDDLNFWFILQQVLSLQVFDAKLCRTWFSLYWLSRSHLQNIIANFFYWLTLPCPWGAIIVTYPCAG